jgi:hypothetical protein
MMRSMFGRALQGGFAVLAVLSSLAAAPVYASTLPADAEIRAGKYVEPADFRQLVATRYDVEFNKVVAADIDRDGDIDVLATTDRTLTVWVNDGAGHLTSQRPSPGPAIGGGVPATTWRGHEDQSDPSTNEDAPPAPVLIARAHAPPLFAADRAALPDSSPALFSRIRSSAPRAPPV